MTTGPATEIFNLDDMTWRDGPDFPSNGNSYFGASVPYGDSFLAVGGRDSEDRNEIVYFDPVEDKWVEMDVSLKFGRGFSSAVLIPDEECS